jgi:methionyl aminopeptidase
VVKQKEVASSALSSIFRYKFHCNPNIVHYGGSKTPGKMEVGHCFTIGALPWFFWSFGLGNSWYHLGMFAEPMINIGTAQLDHWRDDWTAVVKTGDRSAQFEDVVL